MSLIYFGPPFSGPAFSVNPVRPVVDRYNMPRPLQLVT